MRSLVAWLMETLFDWGNFGKQDFDLSIFFFETRFRHGTAGVLSEVDFWFATSVRCLPRAVAQLGSALDWGSRGRRFKSCQPDCDEGGRLASAVYSRRTADSGGNVVRAQRSTSALRAENPIREERFLPSRPGKS